MPTPICNAVFDITTGCNLACKYPCFAHKDNRRATRDVADRLIDWLLEQTGQEKSIGFFGGEPLLEWDLMLWTMAEGRRRAAKRGQKMGFSVTTNGTLLTEEMVRAFVEHGCGVLLSIDGPPDIHDRARVFVDGRGTSSLVLEAAALLIGQAQSLPSLTARVTWQPLLHQDGRRVAEYLVDLGFPDVALCPVDEADYEAAGNGYVRSEHEVADFFIERTLAGRIPPLSFTTKYLVSIYNHLVLGRHQPQTGICGAAKGLVGVGPEGKLYPCHRFAETPFLRRFELGDVWRGLSGEETKFAGLNLYQFENPFECRKCSAWPYCQPPCIGVNGDYEGSLFKTVRGHCVWSRLHIAECVRIHEALLESDYYHEMARRQFAAARGGNGA